MTDGASGGHPLLAVHDVAVAYGGVRTLSGLSLSLDAGDVLAVGGGSGTGKTTLLRAISGLLSLHRGRVTGGRIELSGRSLVGRSAPEVARLGVAFVLEGRRVFPDLTVEDNLRVGAFPLPRRTDVSGVVERVLDYFPLLARRRSTQAGYLSGGEQQLLVIARALVASPRVVLLDEPSLGLAPVAVDQVASVVGGLARAGTGVLVVERRARGFGDAGALAAALEARTVVLDAPTAVA